MPITPMPFEDAAREVGGKSERIPHIYAAELITEQEKSAAMMLGLARAAQQAGLIVTAGAEHDTLDVIPLSPSVKMTIPTGIARRSMKALHDAARRFVAHGDVGYVNASGN